MAHVRKSTLVIAFFLVVAACGGGGDDSEDSLDGVASLDGGSSAEEAGSSGDSPDRASFEDGLLAFTTCMRENGVEIPDIQVDASGAPRIPAGGLSNLDTSSPEFLLAFNACVSILADASPIDVTSDPELSAAIQDQLQEFAQCMRREGVADFPDPFPGFNGRGSPFPLNEIDTSDPNLDSALGQCQSLIAFPTIGG